MTTSKTGYQILILLFLISNMAGIAAAAGNAALSIVPGSSEAGAGQTFMIKVDANPNGNELYGIQFDLYFDPLILEATKVEKGQFLGLDGSQTVNPVKLVNKSLGKIEYAETRLGTQTGAKDPGTLAIITFKVKDSAKIADVQSFVLQNVVISDNNLKEISSDVIGGDFKVIEGGNVAATAEQVNTQKNQVITPELLAKMNKAADTEKILVKISVDTKDSAQNLVDLWTEINSKETEASDINPDSDSLTGKISKKTINEIGDLPFITEITLLQETSAAKQQPGFGIIITVTGIFFIYLMSRKIKT